MAGVLNNSPGGSSDAKIINACGGNINDSGELGAVSLAPCVWSGAGGNDLWSNPSNWANGLVPPVEHPVVINGEVSAAAMVLLDFDLVIKARSLTVGTGDTLTIGSIGSGAYGRATLSVEEPGGLLTNRGTVAISNRSSLRRYPLAVIDNTAGVVRIACRGSGPPNGVTEGSTVQDPCFWDAGGVSSNWSEAANWDSDTLPGPGEAVLVRDADGDITIVKLDISFDLCPQGSLTVAGGQTLNIAEGVSLRVAKQTPGGSIWINGTLDLNGGTLHNQSSGLITNRGTVNVNGETLNNEGHPLVDQTGGKVNNIGGLITNGAGAAFHNMGAMDNDAASNFVLDDLGALINEGAFANAGLFNSASHAGDITNRNGGTIVNSGTMTLDGQGTIANLSGAKITNSGRINMFDSLLDNRGTVENTGTIEVFHFGPYQNLGGLLDIKLGGAFTNAGSTINLADGVINNAGSIINDRNLVNAGTMNNLCSGTVDGPVSGNQPVVVCSIK